MRKLLKRWFGKKNEVVKIDEPDRKYLNDEESLSILGNIYTLNQSGGVNVVNNQSNLFGNNYAQQGNPNTGFGWHPGLAAQYSAASQQQYYETLRQAQALQDRSVINPVSTRPKIADSIDVEFEVIPPKDYIAE